MTGDTSTYLVNNLGRVVSRAGSCPGRGSRRAKEDGHLFLESKHPDFTSLSPIGYTCPQLELTRSFYQTPNFSDGTYRGGEGEEPTSR